MRKRRIRKLRWFNMRAADGCFRDGLTSRHQCRFLHAPAVPEGHGAGRLDLRCMDLHGCPRYDGAGSSEVDFWHAAPRRQRLQTVRSVPPDASARQTRG